MRNRKIPHTDMECAVLCFGPAMAGTTMDEDTTFKMLDVYTELGGNIIDTAHVYADWMNMGSCMSEKTIGNWLASRGMHGKIKIATKGGHYRFDTPDVSRVTPEELHIDIQEGLEYLKADCIDLYWMHRDNTELPAGVLVDFFNEQIKKGIIKAYGGSNWSNQRVAEANAYARKNGLIPLTGVQNMWSCAERNSDIDMDKTLVLCDKDETDFYKKDDIALWAYTSQANGYFNILEDAGEDNLPPHVKNTYHNENNINRLKRINTIAKKYGSDTQTVCLSYLYSQQFPCFAIFGTGNMEHLKKIMQCGDLDLTPQDLDYLEGSKA